MIVVIQCAASKQHNAGYLQRPDNRKVLFVADPSSAPADPSYHYAHPDDMTEAGHSWRQELCNYHEMPGNPFALLPAWKLYSNDTYAQLADCYGSDLYILSAGWGLISADFLTPNYDITFSYVHESYQYKRRRKGDPYEDFCMLPTDNREEIVFFLGKAYIPLACKLTEHISAPKHLFYNAQIGPKAPDFKLHKYKTRTRTNWHYECVRDFMGGKIGI